MPNSQDYNDEIDLLELWGGLVEEKKTISISLLIVVGFAIVYILMVSPVYKSTAYILKPLDKDVQALNALHLFDSSATEYSAGDVFQQYLEVLESRSFQKDIFNQYHLEKLYASNFESLSQQKKLSVMNQALESFGKDLDVNFPKKQSVSQEVTVSLALKETPEQVATILNAMVQHAKVMAVSQIYSGLLSEYEARVQRLNDKIASLRKAAKDRRLDRIAQLDEAIEIAKKLKMAEPKLVGQSVIVNTAEKTNNQGMPLYYLGYRLLEAEKYSLERRKDDEPFIPGLRDLQEKIIQLRDLKIPRSGFGVVTIDQQALPAAKPEKPKKSLILAVAGVVGLMLGVMIALVRRAYRNRKATMSEENS